MVRSKKYSRNSKTATIVGSVLLVVMTLFHGSGISYVSDLMQQSNAESFLKEIFPVLFVYPSIHLLGLAMLGILTLKMSQEIRKVLFAIAVLIVINALVAFYLGAIIPGILLLISAFCFLIGGLHKKGSILAANNRV